MLDRFRRASNSRSVCLGACWTYIAAYVTPHSPVTG